MGGGGGGLSCAAGLVSSSLKGGVVCVCVCLCASVCAGEDRKAIIGGNFFYSNMKFQ